MLYINIGYSTIEAVKSTKHIFGKETITGCTRVSLSDGVVDKGKVRSINDCQKHIEEIKTQLGITGKQDIAVCIANEAALISRFIISSNSTNSQTAKIIDQVKKTLNIDLSAYENFYKTIDTSVESTTILFTALAKSTIQPWIECLSGKDYNLKVLTTRAFCVYEMIKPMISLGQRILLAQIEGKILECSVFDREGVIVTHDKKILKSIQVELKSYIKKIKEEHDISINTIYLSGEGSIGVNTSEIADEIPVPIVKINDVIDDILTAQNVTFETGGTPKVFFFPVLGLFLQAKNDESANFAADFQQADFKESEQRQIPYEIRTEVQDKEPAEKIVEPQQKEQQVEDEIQNQKKELKNDVGMTVQKPISVLPEIVQHKTNGTSQLISLKTLQLVLLFIAVAALAFGLIIVVSGISQGTMKIPFVSQPTLTPTPTIIPTATPTPTIDPFLKRSDLKVSVQNGTERTGYAKETADFLQEKGYENIAKSNAQGDYQQSEIHIKEAKRNYLPLIVEDLKEKIDTSKTETLEESSGFDAIIILGLK